MEILKDKYTWLALVIMILGGGYLLQGSTSPKLEVTTSDSLAVVQTKAAKTSVVRDIQNLESLISENVFRDNDNRKLWDLLNQYNKKPNEVTNRSNAGQILPFSELVINDLLKCLDVDFCGMERDSEDDPYFDPTGTVAHKTIERSLQLMIAAVDISPDLRGKLNPALLERVAEIQSERIQSLVAELIPTEGAINISERQDEIKKIEAALEKNSQGKARASLLVAMSKDKKNNRDDLVSSLQKTFSEADTYTIVSVVENLKFMNLSLDELAKTTVYLCRLKIDDYEHNWKAVKSNVEKIFPDFNKVCNE